MFPRFRKPLWRPNRMKPRADDRDRKARGGSFPRGADRSGRRHCSAARELGWCSGFSPSTPAVGRQKRTDGRGLGRLRGNRRIFSFRRLATFAGAWEGRTDGAGQLAASRIHARYRRKQAQDRSQDGLARIGDRLSAKASRRFVGRESELDILRQAISPNEPATPLSSCTVRVASARRAVGTAASRGGRRGGGVRADRRQRHVSERPRRSRPVWPALCDQAKPPLRSRSWRQVFRRINSVLVIDLFEAFGADERLGARHAAAGIAFAGHHCAGGRQVPDTRWTAHPLWCDAIRCIGLDLLSREELNRLLDVHGVALDAHAGVLDLCHGHPLALVLVATPAAAAWPSSHGIGPGPGEGDETLRRAGADAAASGGA